MLIIIERMRFVNGVSVNLIHDNIQFNSIQQFTMNDKSIKFYIIKGHIILYTSFVHKVRQTPYEKNNIKHTQKS
jgi:hypothetical protein